MYRLQINHSTLALLLLLLLAGCSSRAVFTQKELNQPLESYTPEEQFARDNFKQEQVTEWEKGKPFLYVADALTMLLSPVDGVNDTTQSYKNKSFYFQSIQEQNTYGTPEASLIFSCEGRLYQHKINRSYEQLLQQEFNPLIPNLISLDMINEARHLLVDRKLFIKSPMWYNENDELFEGRKLVEVTITDLTAGNEILPVKVSFVDSRGVEGAIYMRLSTTGATGEFLSFDRLFSFDNIRAVHYPHITDAMWEHITASKPAIGMTHEEVRLAIGEPEKIQRIPTYGGLKEQWYYTTGTFCLFEDGLLTSFR